MLRRTLRSPKDLTPSRIALIGFLVLISCHVALASDVNLNVEVKQAPSATRNDFDLSSLNSGQAANGRVLGASSSRDNKSGFKIIYLLLLINPLLFI